MSLMEERNKFHLVYSGTNVTSLSHEPQEADVGLVRREGNPALPVHYSAEMSPSTHVFSVREYFVSSSKQRKPLARSGDSVPGDITRVAHAPFVELALEK